MANFRPLVLDGTQIEELQNSEDLSVDGHVRASGIITATTFVGNVTGDVTGDVTGNTSRTAGGLTGSPNITVGTITAGEITSVQPACLLIDATTVTVSNANNNTPFEFQTTQTNVGCTVNGAKSKITVPTAGTYLISACIAGIRTNATLPTDSCKFALRKNGSIFPNDQTFPGGVIGTNNNEEFNFTFTLPLTLDANDFLEIVLTDLNSSGGQAQINKGYFSVTRLH